MSILRKLVLDPPILRDTIGGIDEVPRGVDCNSCVKCTEISGSS